MRYVHTRKGFYVAHRGLHMHMRYMYAHVRVYARRGARIGVRAGAYGGTRVYKMSI